MSSSIKFLDAVGEYVDYARLELGQSKYTIDQRLCKFRHFDKFLKDRMGMDNPAAKAIDLATFRAFVKYLVDERNVCPKTVRGYLEAFRALYAYLREYGYVSDSSVHRIKMPKNNPPSRELVSKDELLMMFDACQLLRPKRRAALGAAVLAVYCFGGLRTNELISLRLEDVSFQGEDCILQVRCGKGGKRRSVPMHREAIPFLRNYLALRGDTNLEHFFTANRCRSLGKRSISLLFDEIKWLARIDRPNLKPHALRHNYATRKLGEGINLYHISQLLGHSNIQTTITYLHSDLDQLKEAAQSGGLFDVEKIRIVEQQ